MRKKEIKIAPGVAKTLYPLEWDPNCSDASFNEWQEYINQETVKSPIETEMNRTLNNFKTILNHENN